MDWVEAHLRLLSVFIRKANWMLLRTKVQPFRNQVTGYLSEKSELGMISDHPKKKNSQTHLMYLSLFKEISGAQEYAIILLQE